MIARLPLIAVATILSFGCDRPTNENWKSRSPRPLAESLRDGDIAVQSMRQAAVQRNYDQYFRQYESLRDCYIEVATVVQRDQREDEDVLVVLAKWESIIKVARNAWHEMGNPKTELLLDSEMLSVDVDSAEFRAMKKRIESLNQESNEHWKKIHAEWAPIEARLDRAMAAIQSQR